MISVQLEDYYHDYDDIRRISMRHLLKSVHPHLNIWGRRVSLRGNKAADVITSNPLGGLKAGSIYNSGSNLVRIRCIVSRCGAQ